jgi:nicotinamide riboside kinase
MKKTKVVNLIGAPSVGKSVFAGLIFAELKIKNYVTEYIQEYAKHLVWMEDYETIRNQYYITAQQYKILKSVNNKVDIIVTDGALVHGIYYNRTYKDNVSNIEKTEERIKEYINEFDNIYIFLERGEFKYEKEGRLHTYEESIRIEREIKELLNELCIDYLEIKSDKVNLNKMIDYIIEKSGE